MAAAFAPVPFGRFLLHRRIARGGMAEVFLGTLAGDPLARLFAIKRILPEFSDDPEFVRMFLDEVRIAGRLSHPNIAAMHEAGQVDGLYYLVMDFVAGVNLRSLVGQGHPVPQEIIATAGAGIAGALQHAHALSDDGGAFLGLVHRDVTPHNVMVSFEGEVKLLDFGIAKARTQAERTRSGVLKGKYAYMSPEQIRGEEIDHRSDLFALGAVLYEGATGLRPFSGASPLETFRLVTECNPAPPRTIRHDLSPELDRIILKALSADREARYQSGAELERDLQSFLSERSKVFLPKGLADYVRELFPRRFAAVQEVVEAARRIEGRSAASSMQVEAPRAPSAPFEDLADDVDELAATNVWQRSGEARALRPVGRPRRGPSPLIVLAVVLGVLLGVTLGFGIWLLLTHRGGL